MDLTSNRRKCRVATRPTNYDQGGGHGWEQGDFTEDGFVDVSDLGILATNYGNPSAGVASVPAPSSITMLLCGLASLICWRSRT